MCSASNTANLIDVNLNNYATASIPLGVAGAVKFRVTDTNIDYTGGKFVGYRIAPTSALNVNLINSLSVRTYLNCSLQDSFSENSLLGVGLLNGTSDYVVGFVTN